MAYSFHWLGVLVGLAVLLRILGAFVQHIRRTRSRAWGRRTSTQAATFLRGRLFNEATQADILAAARSLSADDRAALRQYLRATPPRFIAPARRTALLAALDPSLEGDHQTC